MSSSASRRSTSRIFRATPEGKVDFAQDFFGREAFLTVSGQLNVETYCMALSKVYTFGPTFRAENSNTSRHLAEFWMIEPEIAFADLSDDATLAERLLKHILKAVLDERPDDMAFFEERIEKGVIAKLQAIVGQALRAHGLHGSHRDPRVVEAEVRIPREVGHGPAKRARALPRREARERAVDPHELPEGDQGVLHASQRRREDRGGDGRARSRHRRDRRRLAARRAPRRARSRASWNRASIRTRTRGIATCAATAPCRTRDSAWDSSAPSLT